MRRPTVVVLLLSGMLLLVVGLASLGARNEATSRDIRFDDEPELSARTPEAPPARMTAAPPSPPPAPPASVLESLLSTPNLHALEIGGPSSLFRDLHLYDRLATSDNVRFSANTIWEKSKDLTYAWMAGKPLGRLIVADAINLSVIPDASYDVVMSAHNLEHLANPLQSFREQVRVLKPRGVLITVVPNRVEMFDHRRPVTTLEHLLSDLEQNTPETDLSHLDEILELHDLDRDKPAGNKEQFRQRSLKNAENRALHQHVFDEPLMKRIFKRFGVDVVHQHSIWIHCINVGIKQAV